MSRAFFAEVCKLTCWGGSEKGTCTCKGPHDCYGKLKPGWEAAREEAMTRMSRFLRNSLEQNGDGCDDRTKT